MSLTILPRSAWRAKPAKSVEPSDPRKLKGVVVHWFGTPKAAYDHRDCPALLRAVQRAHQAGEFSDIAYSHAVCQHGVAYTLRGFDRQAGANGNKTVNRQYAAAVAMIGKGDKPSGELKDTLREVVAEWRARGAGQEVRTHGSITGSECPGPDLTAWVRVRAYEPKPPVKKQKPVPNSVSTAEYRVDVDVPGRPEKLRNQDPESPAVVGRIEAWKKRFPSVSVLWKRKDKV